MAFTTTDIDRLRRMTHELEGDTNYSDDQLLQILADANGVLSAAAVTIWTEKAAGWSQLVDMQEGESRRNLSDLMDNALEMARTFREQADKDVASPTVRQTTVGRISRA